MIQVDDLSRSLIAFEQISTLVIVVELSQWGQPINARISGYRKSLLGSSKCPAPAKIIPSIDLTNT